jgi:hypothetical protein
MPKQRVIYDIDAPKKNIAVVEYAAEQLDAEKRSDGHSGRHGFEVKLNKKV